MGIGSSTRSLTELRVLFPFVGDSVGGSHHSILELYRCLKNRKDIQAYIVLHNTGDLSNLLDELRIPYKIFPVKNLAGETPNLMNILVGIVSNFIGVQRFLSRNNIDIVHGNDLRINLTWSIPSRLLKNVHYVWHQRTTFSNSWLWNMVSLMSDYFIVISNNVHKTLPGNIPLSKQHLIFNPFNIDIQFEKVESKKWVRLEYNIPENAILLGYVGRLIDWKNIESLLECFSEASLVNDDLYLLIVGTGERKYVEKLKELSLDFGVSKRVIFTGFYSNPNKIISSLDLLVSASYNEPFGRTVVEAMLQKTPVLVTSSGGHLETVNDLITGYLYFYGDTNSFTEKCQRFINNPVERNIIIENAHNMAVSKFSSTKHVEKITTVYKRLVSF